MTLLRLVFLVVLLSAAVALALTNPTMEDYLHFVEQELGRALDRMDQQGSKREQQFIRNVFRVQSQSLMQTVVRPHTKRRNWGLFSRYETTVSDVQVVVIGVGGRFIPIRGVEEATVKIGRMAF
jgi:hypothetical protein